MTGTVTPYSAHDSSVCVSHCFKTHTVQIVNGFLLPSQCSDHTASRGTVDMIARTLSHTRTRRHAGPQAPPPLARTPSTRPPQMRHPHTLHVYPPGDMDGFEVDDRRTVVCAGFGVEFFGSSTSRRATHMRAGGSTLGFLVRIKYLVPFLAWTLVTAPFLAWTLVQL